MSEDDIIQQIKIDAIAGMKNAIQVTTKVSERDGEEYRSASQNTIHLFNRALGSAIYLFLVNKRYKPAESQNDQIHQLRRSKYCPLNQSQINTLFDLNGLRNDLEHQKPPPHVDIWQVQRAAANVHAILPLLVDNTQWENDKNYSETWKGYNIQLGVNECNEIKRHNLPRPDYTSFVGRDKEVDQILDELNHPRRYLISIDGIGGVGKSALAMKIAWDTADEIKKGVSLWKYLVWVSAKEDRLPPTASGIEPIKAGFHVLEDLFDEILLVAGFPEYLDSDIEKKRDAVQLILDSERCLLFIDNFETVEDPAVLDFLDDIPGDSKAIITSRHREIVRNAVRLEGLATWEAQKLIRQTAKEFGVKKYIRDPLVINRIMESTGNIPLALRWVIGQVSLGRSVGDVLTKMSQRTDEIHRFCFDSTVSELDDDYLKVLYVLSQLRNPTEAETISSVSGYPLELIKDILVTLLKYSLVNKTVEDVWQTDLYQLLPLTITYCSGLGAQWPEYAKEVARRGKTESQRQRTIAVANGLYKRYGAYDDNERVAVAAANAAREEHQCGDSDKAIKILNEAIELAPKLGHIHYVKAQILADMNQISEARESFDKAYHLDPKVDVIRNWAEFEYSTGQYFKSRELLMQCFHYQPDDVGLKLRLAETTKRHAERTRHMNHRQEANRLFTEALQHAESALIKDITTETQKQHNLTTYLLMIDIYQGRGNDKKALEVCRLAMKIDPSSSRLRSLSSMLENNVTT